MPLGTLPLYYRDKSLSGRGQEMHVTFNREVPLESASADVAGRLKRWAKAAGFVCSQESVSRWTFRRGSHWQALYTFDIHKIPTRVRVVIAGTQPPVARCEWTIGSPLTTATPGDPARLAEQADLLVAYLKNAPRPERDYPATGNPP